MSARISLQSRGPDTVRHTGSSQRSAGLARLTVLSLVVAVALVGCHAPASPPAEAVVFRAMTFNIHHGEGVDGRVDLERIAAVIREANADLVALQEVDRGVQRTARRDLPAELAGLTGLTAISCSSTRILTTDPTTASGG